MSPQLQQSFGNKRFKTKTDNYIQEQTFYNIFADTKKQKFEYLLNIIDKYYSASRSKKLSSSARLRLFLEFLLNPTNYNKLGSKFNVSSLTAMRIVRFIDYILKFEKITNYPGIWQKGIDEASYQLKLQLFLNTE